MCHVSEGMPTVGLLCSDTLCSAVSDSQFQLRQHRMLLCTQSPSWSHLNFARNSCSAHQHIQPVLQLGDDFETLVRRTQGFGGLQGGSDDVRAVMVGPAHYVLETSTHALKETAFAFCSVYTQHNPNSASLSYRPSSLLAWLLAKYISESCFYVARYNTGQKMDVG